MPCLMTKDGKLRFFFWELPSREEVLRNPMLTKLIKACGGLQDVELEDETKKPEQKTEGPKE